MKHKPIHINLIKTLAIWLSPFKHTYLPLWDADYFLIDIPSRKMINYCKILVYTRFYEEQKCLFKENSASPVLYHTIYSYKL